MPSIDIQNTPRLSLYLRVSHKKTSFLHSFPVGGLFSVTFQTVHTNWPFCLRDYEACAPSALYINPKSLGLLADSPNQRFERCYCIIGLIYIQLPLILDEKYKSLSIE